MAQKSLSSVRFRSSRDLNHSSYQNQARKQILSGSEITIADIRDGFVLRGSSVCSRALAHSHGRCWNGIEDNPTPAAVISERKHAGRALLHASRAANALRILHGQAFISEIHDVDPLMTDRSADVAGNAF